MSGLSCQPLFRNALRFKAPQLVLLILLDKHWSLEGLNAAGGKNPWMQLLSMHINSMPTQQRARSTGKRQFLMDQSGALLDLLDP
jgi:hypothetical protein